jgi:hypothetical protein
LEEELLLELLLPFDELLLEEFDELLEDEFELEFEELFEEEFELLFEDEFELELLLEFDEPLLEELDEPLLEELDEPLEDEFVELLRLARAAVLTCLTHALVAQASIFFWSLSCISISRGDVACAGAAPATAKTPTAAVANVFRL